MNLMLKRITGKFRSTAKMEAHELDLAAKLERYLQVSKSAELAEYMELRKVVKTPEFKEKKKMLQSRKFKDTEEYRTWTKFNKISGNKHFQQYLATCQSDQLKEFLAFQKTADYSRLADKQAVKADARLQQMQAFDRSKEFKNYLRFKGSFMEQEYYKLKAEIEAPDFMSRRDFWQNKQRWQTTEEYKQDERYYELYRSSDIQFYESLSEATIKQLQHYDITFEDQFNWHTIDQSQKWTPGFHYRSPKLKAVHSFVNEQQANMGGKNVTADTIMRIYTKHEPVEAAAWDPKKGFVMKHFDYTSDVINSSEFFRQKNGVIRAKVRCEGHINHGFWMGTDTKLPLVSLFHFDGKNIKLGQIHPDGTEDLEIIHGIRYNEWLIYSLVWTNDELVWYVNNVEVKRSHNNVPQAAMYMAFSSFITEFQKPQEGVFECDWVKVYAVK